MMTEIVDLPTDCLSIVILSLDAFDIANLWFSGSTRLRVVMANGGVTRFKLKLAQTRTRKWPKLVSEFKRLEYLSIGPKRYHSIWFRDVDLIGISSTSLKHLELCFENCEFVLLGIPYVILDSHPDPIFSPPTDGEMRLSSFPMDKSFPKLQTLVLDGKSVPPHLLIPFLPQSLLRLRLSSLCMKADAFGLLPPLLTSLELPNLTELKETVIFPSGLTLLDLSKLNFIMPEIISMIPSTVTDLRFRSCDTGYPKFVHFLPPNLTSLTFGWPPQYPHEDTNGILPRSLLHLCVLSGPQEDMVKLCSFPASLQTLNLPSMGIYTTEDLAMLPKTITNLSIPRATVLSDCFEFFPSNLHSLKLGVAISGPETPYAFMKTLEYLQVLEIDSRALRQMPRLKEIETECFTDDDSSGLRGLSHLRKLLVSSEIELNLEFVTYLPQTLEVLDIWVEKVQDQNLLRLLPRCLQVLKICSDNYNETAIWGKFMSHLPPQLTELEVDCVSFLPDATVRLLPRTLEVLVLPCVTTITDEGILYLPPSLTQGIFSSLTLLTDKCAAYFPRRMRELYLSRCRNISNAAIPHFPRSLTTLYLSENELLDENCIPDLPPQLIHLSVKNQVLSSLGINRPVFITGSFMETLE